MEETSVDVPKSEVKQPVVTSLLAAVGRKRRSSSDIPRAQAALRHDVHRFIQNALDHPDLVKNEDGSRTKAPKATCAAAADVMVHIFNALFDLMVRISDGKSIGLDVWEAAAGMLPSWGTSEEQRSEWMNIVRYNLRGRAEEIAETIHKMKEEKSGNGKVRINAVMESSEIGLYIRPTVMISLLRAKIGKQRVKNVLALDIALALHFQEILSLLLLKGIEDDLETTKDGLLIAPRHVAHGIYMLGHYSHILDSSVIAGAPMSARPAKRARN